MKKVKSFFKWKPVFFKSCMIVFILGALVACSEDNENPRDGDGGINPPTLPEEVEIIDQTLAGFVTDSEGNALSGVTITTGTQQTDVEFSVSQKKDISTLYVHSLMIVKTLMS